MRTYAARRTDEEVVGLTFGTYRVIARGPRVHNHFSLVVVCDTERGGCGREATVEQRRLSDGKKCLCQLPCTVCGGKRDIIRKDLKRDSLCKACKAKHGRKERRDCKGS